MSKGKQSKFLPVYFSVLGAGALGLGYLGWSASSTADEAEGNYKAAVAELDRLESAKLSRTKENAAEKANRVKAYVEQVQGLNKSLMAYQAPIADIENPDFQKKLVDAIKTLTEDAKSKSVKVDEKFDFGMAEYLGGFPIPGTAPALSAQLDALVHLTNAAMDAGVSEINVLNRTKLAIEAEKEEQPKDAPKKPGKPAQKTGAASKPAGAKKEAGPLLDESKVLERQSLAFAVTGKNRSVLNLINALSNASPDKAPHFFIIKTLRTENELKDGPDKNRQVEIKEESDPNNKDNVIKRDAMYLLGNEQVKLHLELDLVRFVPEEAPVEKGKPAAKEKESAAADK